MSLAYFDVESGRRPSPFAGLPARRLAGFPWPRTAIFILPLLLGLAFAVPGHAQTMYKCQNANGKIEYSDRPCWSGAEVKRMTPTGAPTQEEVERARMRAAADRQRVADEKRQAAQERLTAQAPMPATGASGPSGAPPGRDAGDEKVLTHDRSGWDRKPQGQLTAEEVARQQGRERARAGAPDAGKVPTEGQGTWGQEKTLTNSRAGWDTPTRSGQVQSEADRAYRNEKARLSAPVTPSPVPSGPAVVTTCDAGGCWDTGGQRYTASGPALVRSDGRVCQKVGATLTCN